MQGIRAEGVRLQLCVSAQDMIKGALQKLIAPTKIRWESGRQLQH